MPTLRAHVKTLKSYKGYSIRKYTRISKGPGKLTGGGDYEAWKGGRMYFSAYSLEDLKEKINRTR